MEEQHRDLCVDHCDRCMRIRRRCRRQSKCEHCALSNMVPPELGSLICEFVGPPQIMTTLGELIRFVLHWVIDGLDPQSIRNEMVKRTDPTLRKRQLLRKQPYALLDSSDMRSLGHYYVMRWRMRQCPSTSTPTMQEIISYTFDIFVFTHYPMYTLKLVYIWDNNDENIPVLCNVEWELLGLLGIYAHRHIIECECPY